MKRKCPNCLHKSVAVSELILSDVICSNCGKQVGIQWLFRVIFFLVILVATIVVGLAVLVKQGPYAALLMISLPIGAIGIIKASYCPLVVRGQDPGTEKASS
jgi:uncharacterized protein (DUF983 family)